MTQEEVIRGLECCLDTLVQNEHTLAENGVVMYSWQDRAKRIDIIHEAIAVLKAQEPRVMTLGEALRADWCFVEIRKYLRSGDLFYYDTFSGILVENSGIYVIHKRGTSAYVDVDRYGIDWRCWTSRPTDEQRRAIPWNAQEQRDYEAAVEMAEYCERYEPTYNADDGSM